LSKPGKILQEAGWTPDENWFATNGYNFTPFKSNKNSQDPSLSENYEKERFEAIKKQIPDLISGVDEYENLNDQAKLMREEAQSHINHHVKRIDARTSRRNKVDKVLLEPFDEERAINKTTTGYINCPVYLDDDEGILLLAAADKKKPLEVNANLITTESSLMNETSLPLTQSQIKKMNQALERGKDSLKIKLSAKQVQTFKTGGFLPALIAGIPAIASVLGSVYNSYQNKKANDRLVEERIRHNHALEEGKGLWVNNKSRALGKGLWVNKRPRALGGTVGHCRQVNEGKSLWFNNKPRALGGRHCVNEGEGLWVNKRPRALGRHHQVNEGKALGDGHLLNYNKIPKLVEGNVLMKEFLLMQKKKSG
jgi:hypothetical protein